MKKKRRLKKLPIMVLIGIISIIIGIIITVKYIEKINSDEYKLEEIGYTENDFICNHTRTSRFPCRQRGEHSR